MNQAFISHSSKDQPWVDWIAREVESMGVRSYLAQHDPQPGELLSDKVRREIANSDALIVLLTANGYSSPYVQQEIGVAIEQSKLVIPLVHPDLVGAPLAMLAGVEFISFDFGAPPSGSADLLARVRELAIEAEHREVEAQQALKAQQDRFIDGLLVAGVVLGVLYLALRAGDGPGGLAVAG